MSNVESCLGRPAVLGGPLREQIDPYVALPDVEIPEGRWLRAPPARPHLAHRAARPTRTRRRSCCCTRSAAPGMLTWFPRRARSSPSATGWSSSTSAGTAAASSPSSFSLHDCADDVAAVITELGLDDPIVAGYSMGSVDRPARLAPAPRRSSAAWSSPPPPTTSAPTARARLPRRHGDRHGRAADAVASPGPYAAPARSTAEALDVPTTRPRRSGRSRSGAAPARGRWPRPWRRSAATTRPRGCRGSTCRPRSSSPPRTG